MIVDFHTHAFNDALAEKAIGKLAKVSGMPPQSDGTVSDLQKKMRAQGVDTAVVLNIATTAHSMHKVNDFAAQINALPGIVAFGSLHPDAEDWREEIARVKEMGLKGIKLHPHYQGFFVDEERMFPLYEALAEADLLVTFHAGYDPVSPDVNYCTPKAARAAHEAVPGMKMILAHMGEIKEPGETEEYLIGTDILLDTALCARGNIPEEQLTRMIRRHGAEKVLLGSDFPWHRSEEEIALIRSLPLTEEENAMILGGNAQRLLGL